MDPTLRVSVEDAITFLFWAVVIVVTIVAQVAKARQKQAGGSPAGTSPESGGREPDPQAELRRFLESLTGAQSPALPDVPPPPVPVPRRDPPPAPVGARPRAVAANSEPPRTVARQRTQVPVPPPPAVPKPRPPSVPRTAAAPARDETRPPARGRSHHRFLFGPAGNPRERVDALQRAFILQEVLGTPIALRRQGADAAIPGHVQR